MATGPERGSNSAACQSLDVMILVLGYEGQDMDRSKGIAYCGLVCAACEIVDCVGCRDDGCLNRDRCRNRSCCRDKGIDGCWQCNDFPCSGTMFDKTRVRAFALFIKQHGKELLLDCLEKNERDGIRYHHPGKLTGDYDLTETEAGVFQILMSGKEKS